MRRDVTAATDEVSDTRVVNGMQGTAANREVEPEDLVLQPQADVERQGSVGAVPLDKSTAGFFEQAAKACSVRSAMTTCEASCVRRFAITAVAIAPVIGAGDMRDAAISEACSADHRGHVRR